MGKRRSARTVPVALRALVQRINRKLAPEAEVLRAARGEGRARQELGDFYRIDMQRNAVIDTHVDPEALARELGVLHPWERLEERRS